MDHAEEIASPGPGTEYGGVQTRAQIGRNVAIASFNEEFSLWNQQRPRRAIGRNPPVAAS
jgi:hypothetical protein